MAALLLGITSPATGGVTGGATAAHYGFVESGDSDSSFFPPGYRDCLGLVPENASIGGVNDPGQIVWLDVVVLLDDVERGSGTSIMEQSAAPYRLLNIEPRFQFKSVAFSGTDVIGLFAQAKDYVGGARPVDIEAVFVLTTKNVEYLGMPVSGAADCIGGVRSRDFGFAAGRLNDSKQFGTAAHEIGHVLGGDHHLGNCFEGLLVPGGRPCTIMWPVGPRALVFSSLNAAIVRGNAVAYAT